jgi:hypothetical protein
MCRLAYSFRQQKSLIAINFTLSLLSLLTIILLYLIHKNKESRRIFSLVELDLKLIVITGGLTYLLSSINSFLFYGYYFMILLIDLPPCYYISNGFNCMLGQSFFWAIGSITILLCFFAMFLERCYISFGFKSKGTFGFLLALIISVTTISAYFVQYEAKYYDYDRVYCGMALTHLDRNVTSAAYFVIIIDFAVSLMDFGLFIINKRRIRAYK